MELAVAYPVVALHVFFGVLWIGSSAAYTFAALPAVVGLPLPAQRAAVGRLVVAGETLIGGAALGTLILGAAAVYATGRSDRLLAFDSRFAWCVWASVAVVLALQIAGSGRVRILERFKKDEALRAPDQGLTRDALLRGMIQTGRIDLAGFALIVAIMALLRFS
jgi:uncharacterized membrane protein